MCNGNDRDRDRDRFAGIRRALEAAMVTHQCVTIGLNLDRDDTTTTDTTTDGREIEGIVKSVRRNSFTINLDDSRRVKTFRIADVEYVEFG